MDSVTQLEPHIYLGYPPPTYILHTPPASTPTTLPGISFSQLLFRFCWRTCTHWTNTSGPFFPATFGFSLQIRVRFCSVKFYLDNTLTSIPKKLPRLDKTVQPFFDTAYHTYNTYTTSNPQPPKQNPKTPPNYFIIRHFAKEKKKKLNPFPAPSSLIVFLRKEYLQLSLSRDPGSVLVL